MEDDLQTNAASNSNNLQNRPESFINKTGTSKVGAISEAQKAQKNFWKKIEIFEKFFSFKKSRIVPKNVKGDPSGFINIHSVAKYQKTRRGDPLGTKKNFRKKSRTVPKKTQRGDPIVSSCFVSYDKNGLTERGTLCTISNALAVF